MSNLLFFKISQPIGYNTLSLFIDLKNARGDTKVILLDKTSFVGEEENFYKKKIAIQYYLVGIKAITDVLGFNINSIEKESDIIKYNSEEIYHLLDTTRHIKIKMHDLTVDAEKDFFSKNFIQGIELLKFLQIFKKIYKSGDVIFLDRDSWKVKSVCNTPNFPKKIKFKKINELENANFFLNLHLAENEIRLKKKLNKLVKSLCSFEKFKHSKEVLVSIVNTLAGVCIDGKEFVDLDTKQKLKRGELNEDCLNKLAIRLLKSVFTSVVAMFSNPEQKRIYKNFRKINELYFI